MIVPATNLGKVAGISQSRSFCPESHFGSQRFGQNMVKLCPKSDGISLYSEPLPILGTSETHERPIPTIS